jgi:hypothetical protein
VKGADVFESPPEDVDSEDSNFSHNAAIILLKIRLLLDVRALQTSSVIGHKVPQEILDGVHRQLVSCSVVAENRSIMNATNQTPLIQTQETQVKVLYTAIKNMNRPFWRALLNPEKHWRARPEAYCHGSMAQPQLVLHCNLDAWAETPGAVDVIRDIMRQDP